MTNERDAGKVWIDGCVVDAAAARVSVFDRGFLYGDSLFETFTTRSSRALHLDRLGRGCARLGIAIPVAIDAAIDATLSALGEPAAWIRLVVTRGGDERSVGIVPSPDSPSRLIVMARQLAPPPPEIYERGVRAVRVVGVRPLAEVKSSSYLVSVLARIEAMRRGADEALLVDEHGYLREGATSNVFVVHGSSVSTPPLGSILPGVTRGLVLALMSVVEQEIDAPMLAAADEIFVTSSVRGLVPVVAVDGKPVGQGRPGPVFARLAAAYDAR